MPEAESSDDAGGETRRRAWLRAFVDYAAPLAFAVAFFGAPLAGVPEKERFLLATWVLVAASSVALTVGFLVERRVAPLPLFAGLMALIFGLLTLVFNDDSFVKIKVTVVNGLLATVLLGGFLLRRNFMKPLFGEAISLSDKGWRTLMVRYGLWFVVIAVTNEFVWRYEPVNQHWNEIARFLSDLGWHPKEPTANGVWVTFRTALLPAAIVFSLTQVPFMMKHMEKAAPPPPEPGF